MKLDDADDPFNAFRRMPWRRTWRVHYPSLVVIALLTTVDPVKLSAVEALLRSADIKSVVFDRAAGTLWTSIIPMRLMVATDDATKARTVLIQARWVVAGDGEWDLAET